MRVLILLAAVCSVLAKIPSNDKLAAMEKMKMSPKEYKRVMKMHENWYAQAVHGLLTAYAKKMFKTHSNDPHLRKALVACLDDVTDDNAVRETANCLTHAFDGTLIHEMSGKVSKERYSFLVKSNETSTSVESTSDVIIVSNNASTSTSSPATTSSTATISPFKMASARRHRRKGKKGKIYKKNKLHRIRIEDEKRHRRVKRALSAFLGAKMFQPQKKVRRMSKLESILDPSGSGLKSTTSMLDNILRIAKGKGSDRIPFDFMMEKIEKLRDAHVEAKTEDGYRRRMLDTVLGPDHPLKVPDFGDITITNELKNILPNEFKGLTDLLKMIPGIDDKGRDRFLSPRFMPLFPNLDSKDNNSLLSPEIMPMYQLPSLLNTAGLMEKERNGLLSLILESSGAIDVVDEAMDAIQKTREFGLGKDVNDVTQLISGTFDEVKNMFSPKQHEEMEDRDFTFATKAQLVKLYGSQGMYNASEFPMDLDKYEKWTPDEKEQSLQNTIRILADRGKEDHPATYGARHKRALGVPDIVFPDGFVIKFFSHTTLSPFVFSPTFKTLVVLGPTLLSPSMFCPSFVSALLFSPPVISPQLANPIFLSPYVLGPDVMSAAMFNVYVLSPYVMSPNVINPYIASPLILSPYVLCPDVLSPTILSGSILSPSVLSPQMYTKNAMSVSMLSPSFLS